MTQGFYYPPACMMKEFCKFIPLVEKDKAAYIGVKMAFQQDIKNKDLKDLESHQDLEEGPPGKVCRDCRKADLQYYQQLFGEYCYAHLDCTFNLFPTLITADKATQVFMKWYNLALYFHTREWTSTYTRKLFVLPPKCLKSQMKWDIKLIMKKSKYMVDSTTGLTDLNMDLFGMEIEE